VDANKLLVLQEIGYRIPGACSLCQHAAISPGQDWGTCGLYTYEHAKHTGPPRQLSIHRYGRCDKFEIAAGEEEQLGLFEQFLGP
jgi:hypothetical protein